MPFCHLVSLVLDFVQEPTLCWAKRARMLRQAAVAIENPLPHPRPSLYTAGVQRAAAGPAG